MLGRSANKSKGSSSLEPHIISQKEHGINAALIPDYAKQVPLALQQAGFDAFLVGGAVRDLLLGIRPKDFDVATNAKPAEVKEIFRRARIIGRRFQIVHVPFGPNIVEVSTFRALISQKDTQHLKPKERLRHADSAVQHHIADAQGRILRDNVWGKQDEDAARRDFTVNALYYDPNTQCIHDYHGGLKDLQQKALRMIGNPEVRYREDPVRMLRVVRFAAKLGFSIDSATQRPIREMATLINDVPSARLFDEMLKLLLSGHAWACLTQLRSEGLHHGLLPLLDVVLEQPMGEKFIQLALSQTDNRIRTDRSVSPGFLFASLLWHQVLEKWEIYKAQGESSFPALQQAISVVLDSQTEKLAIHRRFTSDMREIMALQPRFEKLSGQAPLRLFENPRFRAAYDFFLLRCESGELPSELGQWWTTFTSVDAEERKNMLLALVPLKAKKKRRSKKQTSAQSEIPNSTAANVDSEKDHA